MADSPNTYYRLSSGTGPPLRVGLIVDRRDRIPAYAEKIIQDIQSSNFARVECLIVVRPPGSSSQTQASAGEACPAAREKRTSLLFRAYLALDRRVKPANDPLAHADCGEVLSGIDTIEAALSGDAISQGTVEEIRARNLDVVLQFGSTPLGGNIGGAAKYGIWSYHFGDPEFYRGGPSYFWELREGAAMSGVVLQACTSETEEPLVLCKSVFATERTVSVSRNRLTPIWGSTDMAIRKLNELHRFGWDYVRKESVRPGPYKGKRARYEFPSSVDMLPWLGQIIAKKAISPIRQKKVQHWRIAIRRDAKPLYEADSDAEYSGFEWIESPKGHFWADPFPFEHGGKNWVFFEDYSYAEKRGTIACSEITSNGELGPALPCVDDGKHHFSYPHVFRSGKEIFMVPESYEAACVELYRCEKFPDRWVRETRLLEGKFVDTTIWHHDGLWWLMTTSAEPAPEAGSLVLFYSPSLTGKWEFHPANPISTDIRFMRCAGGVFRAGEHWIRPSQSGAPEYGCSFSFHQITELSRQHYAERTVKTVTSRHWPGIAGVHTYNRAGAIEFIDGRSALPLSRVRGQDG